jgi:hypothetical protein
MHLSTKSPWKKILDSDVEVAKQKEMFDTEFDTNGDGRLDSIEFKRWVAPSNE